MGNKTANRALNGRVNWEEVEVRAPMNRDRDWLRPALRRDHHRPRPRPPPAKTREVANSVIIAIFELRCGREVSSPICPQYSVPPTIIDSAVRSNCCDL